MWWIPVFHVCWLTFFCLLHTICSILTAGPCRDEQQGFVSQSWHRFSLCCMEVTFFEWHFVQFISSKTWHHSINRKKLRSRQVHSQQSWIVEAVVSKKHFVSVIWKTIFFGKPEMKCICKALALSNQIMLQSCRSVAFVQLAMSTNERSKLKSDEAHSTWAILWSCPKHHCVLSSEASGYGP